MPGKLYIVATPIGNLADMTYRAVETLQAVDTIACEDTRVTGKLCAHYDIATKRVAIHHHTATETLERLVHKMHEGHSVAYVSDAGTPGISDPGNQLVAAAVRGEIEIVPIPGPSAVAAILSIAGINTQTFQFVAYPPHKKGRKTFFEHVVAADEPVVYYDSVHRVVKNLGLLSEMSPEREVIVGRELTKMFEEIQRGTVSDVVAYFTEHPEKVKGEFVIVVKP